MGTRKWHAARAERHLEAANHLAATGFEDWGAIALFYSALHHVHSSLSGDPTLRKDERHPRKHTSYGGSGTGGRGTNRLVTDLFPADVDIAYRSLFEASLRTRYDSDRLSKTLPASSAFKMLRIQHQEVARYCHGLNTTRRDISTQQP